MIVINIKDLTKKQDLLNVISESSNKPMFVFKHSTICPISLHAEDQWSKFQNTNPQVKKSFS